MTIHRRAGNDRISRLYLIAGAVAVICYLRVPGLAGNTVLFELVGASSAVAIITGVIRYRPRPLAPWLLFILAQVLFLAGDFFYYTFNLEFPAPADALYLAYYPLQAAGLLLVIRRRTPGKDTASLIDALIVAIGFGLPSWVYLIEPYTHDSTLSQVSSLVSMAYPVMDVILLSVAVRLLLGRGSRPRAFHLLTGSILVLVLTDVAYGAIELNGSYGVGSALDVGWMISYLLWGAAVLHPSVRDVSTCAPDTNVSLTARRIMILAAAVMIGPAMIAANSWWPINRFDLPVVMVATGLMFLLTLVRIMGLAASLRSAVARHERAERRETILRHVATALTAAPGREHIRASAIDGALDLVSGLAEVDVDVEFCDGTERDPAPAVSGPSEVVIDLSTQASFYGRLVVTSTRPVPTDVVDGLRTLGAQVALALEASALGEDLSRQRSEARVGALVQNSSEMIMVIDADLVIRYATPSVGQALGHLPEDLVGRPAASMVDPSEEEDVIAFYTRIKERPGHSFTSEWRMKRADGQLTDVEAVVTNLLENPSVGGIVVTSHDITDRKALESGLIRQVTKLEELDRIRSEFVATVSHELRTPLTSILGEVEMLVDGDRGDLSSCQAHGVEAIARNGERLLRLIDDLLTLSHIETGALDLSREPTAVASLFETARAQIEPIVEGKAVRLRFECCPEAGVVMVDEELIDRALLNLLTNAVKFTPAGGTVTVRAVRSDDDLVITVSDTGLGIPEDEQSRLFSRFFRSSVATRMAIQGTGLGLTIVKQIVVEHGGTISISSTPDVGTTVTVRIPAPDVGEIESEVA